jgi:hypothetical protein
MIEPTFGAPLVAANPLPENRFWRNRHPPTQADF